MKRASTRSYVGDVIGKHCIDCEKWKPLTQYPQHGQRESAHCRPCNGDRIRMKKYKLTREELKALGKRCTICKKKEPKGEKRFPIDHDHVTGKTRGKLCPQCNSILGLCGDDPKILKKAIRYLKRHSW